MSVTFIVKIIYCKFRSVKFIYLHIVNVISKQSILFMCNGACEGRLKMILEQVGENVFHCLNEKSITDVHYSYLVQYNFIKS